MTQEMKYNERRMNEGEPSERKWDEGELDEERQNEREMGEEIMNEEKLNRRGLSEGKENVWRRKGRKKDERERNEGEGVRGKNVTRHRAAGLKGAGIMAVGVVMVVLTYVGAGAMVMAPHPLVKVGGWIFLAFKGSMVASSLLAMLRRPYLGWRVFVGRYCFDTEHPRHGLAQAFTRFWWELPQLWLGYLVSQWRVIIGQIDRVETLGGVTFAIDERRQDGMEMGLSLGNYVNIWLSDSMGADFEYHVRYHSGQIFMHEYGHTVDSVRWGWLYLMVVGIPSYISQMVELATHGNRHQHRHLYAERWANRNAERYFEVRMRELDE